MYKENVFMKKFLWTTDMKIMPNLVLLALILSLVTGGCATSDERVDPQRLVGMQWEEAETAANALNREFFAVTSNTWLEYWYLNTDRGVDRFAVIADVQADGSVVVRDVRHRPIHSP